MDTKSSAYEVIKSSSAVKPPEYPIYTVDDPIVGSPPRAPSILSGGPLPVLIRNADGDLEFVAADSPEGIEAMKDIHTMADDDDDDVDANKGHRNFGDKDKSATEGGKNGRKISSVSLYNMTFLMDEDLIEMDRVQSNQNTHCDFYWEDNTP